MYDLLAHIFIYPQPACIASLNAKWVDVGSRSLTMWPTNRSANQTCMIYSVVKSFSSIRLICCKQCYTYYNGLQPNIKYLFCDDLGMTVHSVIYKRIILNIANYSKFKRLAAVKNFILFEVFSAK